VNFGRRQSVWSGLTAGVFSAAALIVLLSLGVDVASPLMIGVAGVMVGALTIAVVFPFGAIVDRAAARLRKAVDEARSSEQRASISSSGCLGALALSIDETLGSMSDRLQDAQTELREIEIRRRVSESERQHTEAVLHSLRDAVLVTDPFNELTMANERAAELFGFDINESMHRPIEELIDDDRLLRLIRDAREMAAAGQRRTAEYVRDGDGVADEEGISEGTHGRECYDVSLTCLPDPQHEVGGVVTILRDVTQEREISQMKSEFVSKVSHELRTPLSSIKAYVELLLDGEAHDEDSRQEFYSIIKNESDRLGRLIDNMLNISRIEAGIIKINRSEVDFVKAAQRAVDVIVPQAKLKNIAVSINATPLTYTAMADPDMIHQVMLNLLSNAVKYTPEGGRVSVNIENDDTPGSVLMTIVDTGLGIPPDALGRIFDKFYRIENYKRVAKGTGLGLSLVKHIVETVHHGQVNVTSELGMGSRFSFSIPYQPELLAGAA